MHTKIKYKPLVLYLCSIVFYFVVVIVAFWTINKIVLESTGGVTSLPVAELAMSVLFAIVSSIPTFFKLPFVTLCMLTGSAIWRIYVMHHFSKTFYTALNLGETPFFPIAALSFLIGIMIEVVRRYLLKKAM